MWRLSALVFIVRHHPTRCTVKRAIVDMTVDVEEELLVFVLIYGGGLCISHALVSFDRTVVPVYWLNGIDVNALQGLDVEISSVWTNSSLP